MSDDLISKIDFFKKCKDVKQDFSGYSSALRYMRHISFSAFMKLKKIIKNTL